MSNDYAAIISAALVAVLVIGTVEMYSSRKALREQHVEMIKMWGPPTIGDFDIYRRGVRTPAGKAHRAFQRTGKLPIDVAVPFKEQVQRAAHGDWPTFMRQQKRQLYLSRIWFGLCVLMSSALVLTFAWAAVDGHGPARWLAAYSLATTCTGITAVLGVTLSKARQEMLLLRTQSLEMEITHRRWGNPRSNAAASGAQNGEPAPSGGERHDGANASP
ncbi:hypothetical protein [Streptomyces althioticus]|uniref:hypothetical protein n=1 Tax=Streptomyces althioticus TaxID=83380 RepID=UPI003EBB8BA1